MTKRKLCCTILIIVTTIFASPVLNRTAYGTSKTGLWSKLTQFEESSITMATNAQQGDADALLALALIGSGDIRTEKQYSEIRTQILNFNKSIAQELTDKTTQREQARLIYTRMLETFFEYDVTKERLLGYQLQQSKLSEIFSTKKFNCVSSSILYMILLSYADISSKGVLVPSHVFVQIETTDGEIIEVETTSLSGFNFKHTKENVEGKSRHWYLQRGLEYYNWEGYLRRKIATPFFIIMRNYSNQHTSSKRMHFEDRLRLSEIAHKVCYTNEMALQRRIGHYLNESNYLTKDSSEISHRNFYTTITPFLDTLSTATLADTAQLYLHLLKLNKVIAALESSTTEQNSKEFLTFLQKLPSSLHTNSAIYQNVLFVTTSISKTLQKEDKQKELKQFFSGISPLFPAISKESIGLIQIQYAMQIRSISQTIATESLSEAIAQYLSFLKNLPNKIKKDTLIANNTFYLLEQLIRRCYSSLDANAASSILSATDQYYPLLQSKTKDLFPLITNLKVERIINMAKAGKLSVAKAEYLQLLLSLSTKEKEDRTIRHNLSYFLFYLSVHDRSIENPTLKDVLNRTQQSTPSLKQTVHTITQSLLHNELIALINRVPENRDTLIRDITAFIETIPSDASNSEKLLNNITYLYQQLTTSGDTTGLVQLQIDLCRSFPTNCETFKQIQSLESSEQNAIIQIDSLLNRKNTTAATKQYRDLIGTMPTEALKDTLLQYNLKYITEKIAIHTLKNSAQNLPELLNTIKKQKPSLYAITLPIKAQYHFQEGNKYWNRKEWKQAAEHFTEALPLTTNKKNRNALCQNLDGAFYNWAIIVLNRGDREQSLQIISKGLELYPDGKHCTQLLKKLKQ